MKIWKKALSGAMSAALLASLLGTAFASSVLAATDASGYLKTCTPASCSVVGDGISTIVITNDTDSKTVPVGNTLYATISGATFIAAGGDFTLAGGVITAPASAVITGAGDSVVVRAPSAPGAATISFYHIPTAGGNAVLEGTFSLDFYASGSTAISAANSTVTASSTTLPADGSVGATVTVVVKDGVSPTPNIIAAGITVNASISNVGLISANGGAFAQVAADGSTAYVIDVKGSGLAGTGTLSLWVTDNTSGVSTTLPPVSFVFSGDTASVVATGVHTAIGVGAPAVLGAITFVTKDTAGNKTASTATVVVTGTALLAPVNGAAVTANATSTTAGKVTVQCGATVGSATVAVKDNGITSNAITIYCSKAAASFTAAFEPTTVTPGGTATLKVTVLDDGGRPAPDTTSVTVYVSAGVIVGGNTHNTENGVAELTYLAPFNTGVASANVVVDALAGQNPQINVGAVVPAVTAGTNASALGATKTGTYTATTKIAALGTYQTFQLCYGAGAAGHMVGILVATKNSAGVWSSFTRLTGRAADSAGCAYFWWRTASAAWISVRGDLDGTLTPAVQGRWR